MSARQIPTCGHYFHQHCTIQLIQNGCKNCPICRSEIRFAGGAEPPAPNAIPLGADDRRRIRQVGANIRERRRRGNRVERQPQNIFWAGLQNIANWLPVDR